jgi:C1A family cysteine protease
MARFCDSGNEHESWYGTEPTIIPLPSDSDSVVGGHAVMVVGYNNASRLFKIRNSWRAGVGEGGHFYMPYGYMTNPDLASDFWVINAMKD